MQELQDENALQFVKHAHAPMAAVNPLQHNSTENSTSRHHSSCGIPIYSQVDTLYNLILIIMPRSLSQAQLSQLSQAQLTCQCLDVSCFELRTAELITQLHKQAAYVCKFYRLIESLIMIMLRFQC